MQKLKPAVIACTFLTALLFLSAARSNENTYIPQIYTISLDYRLNESGTAHYNKLLERIKSHGLVFNHLTRSLPRSVRNMLEDKQACMFPATKNAAYKIAPDFQKIALIASKPIDRISLHIFTKKDKPKITELKELNGKTIAVWNGLDTNSFLKGIEVKSIEKTPNEEIRVRMLNAGRVDAILGFMPDVFLITDALDIDAPHYDEKFALLKDEGASLICHDTPDNRAFIKVFNSKITELKENGDLQKILGPHANIVN